MNIRETLYHYWKYEHFRPLQEDIITQVLAGKDVFAMLPTGAGKSLCYQVPALLFRGITLVVSPLIALIEDQVNSLVKLGIPAVSIHSGLDRTLLEQLMDEIADGAYKLVYVSPERLQNAQFLDLMAGLDLSFLAIDEAHCISQWGHDFRPAYRNISAFKALFPKTPTLAITASATLAVKQDIMQQLSLKQPVVFEQSVVRANLAYHILYTENKPLSLTETLMEAEGSGIVYCKTRKRTVECAQIIKDRTALPAYHYHAGMRKMEKDFSYHQWLNSSNAIMTATTAFGMGIDKADVRNVIHYDLPSSIEQYYQEVGRAGRDGLPARGMLLYHIADINNLLNLPEIQFPPIDFIKTVYQHLADYLGIAVNNGNEEVFAFDVATFVSRFKLEMLPTISAVKILERQGFLEWNENAQTQYTVRFTTSRESLNYIEKHYKPLHEVVEMLLRHFGSIFHFETPIPIFKVAQALKIDKTVLEDRLYQLQDFGILQYKPAIIGSYILWQHDRFTLTYLRLDEKLLRQMKNALQEQVTQLAAFIHNDTVCRNKLLSAYFGQQQEDACGQCDNCLKRQNEIQYNTPELRKRIVAELKNATSMKVNDLLWKLKEVHKETILAVLQGLTEDGIVYYNKGIISL
ncbi:RecQ family ATP-dependent DNA helicase [Taibaiella sp. KBW10]|uniref:RecQ family ATP-dependent DNA helicase n=1 Tax=Taibaiella sp. KBW10 TaxID=2153357 RepID=UPI000F5B1C62|nr:RecQ family ATP-dependent DNA helicase [Taibaiella sp. KBW10]RQO32079.1 RecQ family ATP-dependent DNA helicase [Taibaiella sp. KBW10]